MKVARKTFFGLAVVGIAVFISGLSFAQMAPAAGEDASVKQARHDAKIKLLQDSAAALQTVNPDLSKRLSDLVNEDANKSKGQLVSGKEKTAKDTMEWKAKHEAKMLLYKDAAEALAVSHPDLAKGLNDLSELKAKPEIPKALEEKK
jgi:hypothetical protein